ncbi:MAG TPA: hypothetical protein PKA27_06840 [Fimbriimonadaceae bacterium]|nr:hypothetical protein [Fimbriimonadaceae bacterium]
MADPMVGTERLEAVKVREAIGDDLVKVKEYRGDTFLCVSPIRSSRLWRF